ncbi:hypothetical protein LYZ74_22570, partial [Xanthomonas hortorum pv. gardneri]|uniref:hypothetical protein n=1 Tax=Xanthomonas hortorum TaxID=56454 RepID=UPI001F2C1BA1
NSSAICRSKSGFICLHRDIDSLQRATGLAPLRWWGRLFHDLEMRDMRQTLSRRHQDNHRPFYNVLG